MLFREWEIIDKNTCEKFESALFLDAVPSLFFRKLFDYGNLHTLFPELAILVKVEQLKSYHPEGNVFEHTMQAIDVAAQFSYHSAEEKRIVMLAVLCHDYGKAKSFFSGEGMKEHDIAGVPLTEKFLQRFLYSKQVIKTVCKLVLYHKKPSTIFAEKPNMDGYNCLKKLCGKTSELRLLLWVFWADIRGRNGVPERFFEIDGKLHDFIRRTYNIT